MAAPVDIRARQLPDVSQPPEPFDPESNTLNPGLPGDEPPSEIDGTNDFERESPDLDPTERFSNEVNGFPLPSSEDDGSTFPERDSSSSSSSSSLPERLNGITLSDSDDRNIENSEEFSGESLRDRINSNRLPDSETSNLESFFNGDPVEDEPVLEILEEIQAVQEFPVNDDGTLSDDDIDELQDILDDEEEQVEELVDEGRLSKAQGNLIQAEIDPLRTGLDVIDENSIDTGDRLIDGGKTFASVLDPMAGTAMTLLDEVGILGPIGNFLGDAFDATIGKIFKK